MYDIISIGDTTTDIFLEVDQAQINCDVQKDICHVCINYADKIPVQSLVKLYGVGNAANSAIGSAKMGLKSALFTILGDDLDGAQAKKVLFEGGVSEEYVTTLAHQNTNYSVVLNFDGERSILVFHEKRDYSLPKLEQASWIYLTSVGEGHQKLHKQVLNYIKKTKAKLAFNPGTHQMKAGLKALKPVFAKSDVVSINKEEAERILKKGNTEITSLLKAYHKMGIKNVVITDGPKGSYAYDGKHIYHLPIFETPVVERTGAGDAFTTAFVCALFYGKDIKDAMRWGTFNSSAVVQHVGAQAGLLYREDVEKICKKYKDFIPKKVG